MFNKCKRSFYELSHCRLEIFGSSLEAGTRHPLGNVTHWCAFFHLSFFGRVVSIHVHIGKASTRKAPGWAAIDIWPTPFSAMSTRGSDPSGSIEYPWDILRINAVAELISECC